MMLFISPALTLLATCLPTTRSCSRGMHDEMPPNYPAKLPAASSGPARFAPRGSIGFAVMSPRRFCLRRTRHIQYSSTTSGAADRTTITGTQRNHAGMNFIMTSWATNEPDAMNNPKHIRQR